MIRAAATLAVLLTLTGAAAAQDVLQPRVPQPPGAGPATMAPPGDPTTDPNATPPPPPKPAPTPAPTPAPPAPSWTKHAVALLQALDKVDGQSTTLALPVGQTATYRNIAIQVQACFARPPEQAADATAYLVIQDKAASAPSFVGWMLAAEPAANMMEHPVYDVRVLGCR